MAAKWTADWENRIFILKPGVVELDVQVDLYSDWKEEVQLDDNMKWAPALRAVGGDPISDVQNLGSTYFLINGWKIRPQEADHELLIVGNLYTDPYGESTVIPTLGTYTVLVTHRVSNLVDASVARLDLTQLLQAVYVDEFNGVPGTAEGVGTPTNPVDNIADAFTIAVRDKLRAFNIRGSFTLDRNITNWSFKGTGGEISDTINIGGFDVNNCDFHNISIEGTMEGQIEADQCTLGILVGLDGIFRECHIESDIVIDNDAIVSFYSCVSKISEDIPPIIDFGSNVNFNLRNYSGIIKFENFTAGCYASVDMDPGCLILDETCTGGHIVIRGTGLLTDGSNGTTVVKCGFVDGTDVQMTRKITTNRLETNPDTGKLIVYDDDGSPLLQADIYEDVDGSQKYRGQGAERRNKMEVL